jgi:hypothetical protein
VNSSIAAFRTASVVVLLLAIPALFATAGCVLGSVTETTKLLRAFPLQIAVGFGTMLLLAWAATPSFAVSCLDSLVTSGWFGAGEFVAGVLAASLSTMLLAGDFSVYDYVLKPLFWVVPTGIVPAFVLGCVGGLIARRLDRSP